MRLRIGVSALDHEAAGEAPVEGGLQRVIAAVRSAVPFTRCCRAAEFLIERAAIVARPGYLRRVDIQESKAIHGGRADVSNRVRNSPGNLCSMMKFHDWM